MALQQQGQSINWYAMQSRTNGQILSTNYRLHTILFPHSGQNFVPASNFVPHLLHSFFGRSALPHSGQNFAPCVRAPHAGHSATASDVKSMPLVRSCCCSFCFIWSTVVCTCADANSVSISGAQSKQSERFAFQHEVAQTQCVHLGHWRKFGLASSMALRNAESCAGPRTARSIS